MAVDRKKSAPHSRPSWVSRLLTALLLVFAGFTLLLAQTAYWINHNIFDQEQFTNTVTESITSEDSRNAIASSVTQRVLADRPVAMRLAGDRLTALVSGVLGSDLGERAIRTVTERGYAYLTADNREDIDIDLTSIKQPIEAILGVVEQFGGNVDIDTARIPDTIVLVESDNLPNLSGSVKTMLWLGPLLWLSTIVSFGVYIYIGLREYARRVYIAGSVILLTAVIGMLTKPVLPPPLASLVNDVKVRPAALNVINAFLEPYFAQMIWMFWATILALIIFNQRFNIVSVIHKGAQTIGLANKDRPKKK